MPKPKKPRKKSVRKKHVWEPEALERHRARMLDPTYRVKLNAGRNKAFTERPQDFFRRGVPDGMRKKEAMVLWAKAEEQSRKFIKIMEDKGLVDEIVIPGSDEEMAKLALQEAYKMAVSPLTNAQCKGGYIRTVLEWTKAKPESKSKLTLDKSEEWLAALAADLDDCK